MNSFHPLPGPPLRFVTVVHRVPFLVRIRDRLKPFRSQPPRTTGADRIQHIPGAANLFASHVQPEADESFVLAPGLGWRQAGGAVGGGPVSFDSVLFFSSLV